jgi:hypothetical protein
LSTNQTKLSFHLQLIFVHAEISDRSGHIFPEICANFGSRVRSSRTSDVSHAAIRSQFQLGDSQHCYRKSYQISTIDDPDWLADVPPRPQRHLLLGPSEIYRCVTFRLIGLLKDSLDVLHNWEIRRPGEWNRLACIISMIACFDFAISPLALAWRSSPISWQLRMALTEKTAPILAGKIDMRSIFTVKRRKRSITKLENS